ncbi:MAG: DUF58 domain-containing protein [Acidobacteria bacterium]|nr:DUF58 domain-containing protein [Acidobacteriota bacterium]
MRTRKQSVRELVFASLLLATALGAAVGASVSARMGASSVAAFFSFVALIEAVVISFTLVPRLARQVDFTVLRLPFLFQVTREGMLFLLFTFFVILAAVNTGNNLLFLILAVLLSTILASGMIARAILRDIYVSLEMPDTAFAGQRTQLKLTVKNFRKFLPSFSLWIEGYRKPSLESLRLGWAQRSVLGERIIRRILQWPFTLSLLEAEKLLPREEDRSIISNQMFVPVLGAGKSVNQVVSYQFPRRGRYTLDGFRIFTSFPFGFFRKGRRVTARGEFLVYPRIHPVDSCYHLLPFLDGHFESPYRGTGSDLYVHRQYLAGDNARFVDWKASAKISSLLVKEFSKEDDRRVYIYLDNEPGAEVDDAAFEKAVEFAGSLAAHFIEEGAEVQLWSATASTECAAGRSHLFRLLDFLAVLEKATRESPAEESLGAGRDAFKIYLTAKPKGTIPPPIWRTSHVVYFDDL